MIRFVVLTWGLVIGWGWWLFAAKSSAATLVIGLLLGVITLALAGAMFRRSRRFRSEHEHVNARLEYHSKAGSRHWQRSKPARGDDGGAAMSLGGGL